MRTFVKFYWRCQKSGCQKRTENKRLAFAAPRGHAKSTIVTLFYVMWSICYEKEKFVFILSATANQAQKLLSEIKGTLQSNERLRQDFPESLCQKREGPDQMDAA